MPPRNQTGGHKHRRDTTASFVRRLHGRYLQDVGKKFVAMMRGHLSFGFLRNMNNFDAKETCAGVCVREAGKV